MAAKDTPEKIRKKAFHLVGIELQRASFRWRVTVLALSMGVSRVLCKRPGFVFGDGVRGRGQFPFPGPTI
jgi:hypothetical protein